MRMSIKLKKVVVVWGMATIFLISPSYSQMGEVQFERISIESGLSQSTVLCICQDSKGFLWFGTYEGLNRYDGYTFKVYKNDPAIPYSLSEKNVDYIIEDHLGVLWVGTENGLNRFDREKERFISYKNNPNDTNSLSNNFIRYLYEDRSGILWIGTQGGGLNQFDRKNEKFIHYENDPNNPKSLSNNNVLSILEDSYGHLWIGTDYGLNYFDREKGEFIQYLNDPHDPRSISHNSIWRISEDREGSLWIGTWGGGLIRFDPQQNRFVTYRNDPKNPNSLSNNIVRAIYEDHDGNLWIGTDGGGLDKFVPGPKVGGKDHFIHYQNNPQDPASLSGNSVLSIFEDKLGILWIGTNFDGIDKYNSKKSQFSLYRNHPDDVNSLCKNTVLAVCEDSQGMIWIGTNGGGLDCFDRKKNRFTHYVYDPKNPYSISNNTIRSIFEDRHKRLCIGTDNGFNYFNREEGKFIRYQNDPNNPHSISHNGIWRICEDRAGNLWLGTFGGGLNRFDYTKGEFTRYIHDPNDPKSISDYSVWTMYEDSYGNFWIGTFLEGLDRFDREKGIFFHYRPDSRDSNSICDKKVISLYEDHAGCFWVGTSNGLDKFDRNARTFHQYSKIDGLPNNNIQGILEDDHGNLWMGTTHGLSKFNPRTIKFSNYYESYGLQSNEFGTNTCCKLKSGEMIFGGMNGFNIFYPDSIHADTSRPPVVITDFQIFNKPVPVGEGVDGRTILQRSISECDEIHLSYKDNVFSFEFAGLHYVSPKGNLYAYMMEGFEKEWIYTDANRRFVTYTNLPGGIYTFRVKASNNQGTWNNEGTSIRIIITPPFWKTIWFYGILLVVIAGIVYWVFQWRVQARDLAAQRRMDAALTKERNLIRTLIDNLPDAVYVKDAQCRKVIANLADVHYMGLESEAEVLGKNDYDFYPSEIASSIYDDDQSVIQTGQPILNKEELYIDKEGNKHWTLISKLPLRDGKSRITGLVGVRREITQQKREEALLKAKEAAEAATEAKSRFLAVMSHEIRTPMNGILAVTELLLMTQLTARQKELIDTMQSSGKLLLTIINDILDLSKIEYGDLEFHLQPTNLRECLQEVCGLLKSQSVKKGIGLSLTIDSQVPSTVITDKARMMQVLFNITGNAVKFTDEGEVSVTVSAEKIENESCRLIFTVKDTGIGMLPEDMENLFKPFTQIDSSKTRKYGGTGLGLAIASKIAEKMGGEINARSEIGIGSTFYFTLVVPIVEETDSPKKESDAEKHQYQRPASSQVKTSLKILVAEDNLTNQFVIRQTLMNFGYQCDVVSNGIEAVEAEKKSHYDVIFMDIHMPKLDGYKAATQIVEMRKNQKMPTIIALTADVIDSVKEQCLACGMSSFLAKPISIKEIKNILDQLEKENSGTTETSAIENDATVVSIKDRLCALGFDADPSLVVNFLETVYSDMQTNVYDAKAAYESNDSESLRLHVHSLKGAATNAGAAGLADVCKRIGLNANGSFLEVFKEAYAEFDAWCSQTYRALLYVKEEFSRQMKT